MAYVNKFSVKIPQGDEDASGYVCLKHGARYSLLLRNSKQLRCNAKVEIDGKYQGTWRIPAGEEIIVERPAHDNGYFTFYKLASSESKAIGLDGADPNLGLVKVTFTPEKIQQYVNTVRTYSGTGGGQSYSLSSKGIKKVGVLESCLLEVLDCLGKVPKNLDKQEKLNSTTARKP